MGALVVFLLLTLILFGAGFTMKALWYIALFFLVVWLVGFLAAGPQRRWYRW